jgi:hypothetical protein
MLYIHIIISYINMFVFCDAAFRPYPCLGMVP